MYNDFDRRAFLKVGSLTMSMAVPAWYSNFMKPIDAFTLPYIVSSPERLKAALDGNVGKEINKMGQGAGFQVFGYWLLGGRHIVNKVRPINVPADCQGLKLRVINSQVYIQAFRALGASTVAMEPAELYVAMQALSTASNIRCRTSGTSSEVIKYVS
jgi:C4-dicarboxylate-binding protein DctP